ncbi:response regulator [Pseudogemmobacter humi]|uniref:histidine kinase n=1 Tax=Pseudogemmobacter humi TaxID=2483812 RepID=A0A3P5XFW3_9RHOB|nr:response regulator [Pseudogemmobacter humi]VDC33657.1 Signal transduction histidine-protein kinase BarA [Pseudogemmobacter humi]
MAKPRSAPYEVTLFLAVAAIIAATFVVDGLVPLGTNVWLAYLLPLVLAFMSRLPWLPVLVAATAIIAMAIGVFLSPDGVRPQIAILNRSIAAVVMLILAGLGVAMIRYRLRLTALDWEQRAEVRLAQALQGDPDAATIGERALATLADVLDARAAAAWVAQGPHLKRIAAWGLDADTRGDGDQGHLRRALNEGRVIGLTADPEHALGWRSGLLRGRTVHSVIVPAKVGPVVNGVLEFGLDHPLSDRARDLLEQVSVMLGAELRSAAYRTELHDLIEETRRQAEELRSHTEELAASNEELEEQTSALQISEARLREQQAVLEEQNARLEEQRDAIARSRRQLSDQAQVLARESRYKSEFVANMSHELRTPLNALLIMARLLAENRGRTLSEEQLRWAETIEASGKDLLALINDILDLSKIEAGKVEVNPESVSPAALAGQLKTSFEAQARQKGLDFTLDLAPDIARIVTDPARVGQILRNFLSNALKFTDKGGVTLGVKPDGTGVAISVKDTGIGISESDQKAVFEPFRQADGTISRRYGGTGLGLSISRDLAELLGGKITLDSRPGQGSTFTLHLPDQAPGASAALPPQMPQDMPLGRLPGFTDDRDLPDRTERLLLIVEDDPAFARLLFDLAHEMDFGAIVVGTADDAIRAAHDHRIRGIILDIGLPDHSGMTVLDRLKRDAETRHIPVHVVSANDHIRAALEQGAVSYLLKPVEREALVQALEALGRQLEHHLRRVLIVEDDPAQLEGLRELLRSDEVETQGAATAAEALEACRATTFDCIVLDMTLPDASGFDLLEKLSEDETASFPPVIVYTARALSEAEEQRLRRHSRSIIIKGAKSPERLIDEVTLFLHQVVSDLPPRQREMLAASLNRDAQLEGRRILVVEDDIRNIYALSGIFEPHGAEVQIARNGREALDALARVAEGTAPKVDLVLMDVMMPEMDGLTATREIRRDPRWKTLPIIMLTAKAMADDHAQCLAAGANDYLSKPLDVDKLLSLARVWMPK